MENREKLGYEIRKFMEFRNFLIIKLYLLNFPAVRGGKEKSRVVHAKIPSPQVMFNGFLLVTMNVLNSCNKF